MIIYYLDKLAGWWIDYRTEQRIKNDPVLNDMQLKKMSLEASGLDVTIVSPMIATR